MKRKRKQRKRRRRKRRGDFRSMENMNFFEVF
jgi:hypothetical protein